MYNIRVASFLSLAVLPGFLLIAIACGGDQEVQVDSPVSTPAVSAPAVNTPAVSMPTGSTPVPDKPQPTPDSRVQVGDRMSLEEYLKDCAVATLGDVEAELTLEGFGVVLSAYIDQLESAEPPEEVAAWHTAVLIYQRAVKKAIDDAPALADEESEAEYILGVLFPAAMQHQPAIDEAVAGMDRELLSRMNDAGCIDDETVSVMQQVPEREEVPVGSGITAQTADPDATDYFRFQAEKDQSYVIEANWDSLEAVQVLIKTPPPIGSISRLHSKDSPAWGFWTAPDSGTYHIDVSWTGAAGATYVLSVLLDNSPGKPANTIYSWEGSEVRVSWDPVEGAEYYRVFHDDFFETGCTLQRDGSPKWCDELAARVVDTSYPHSSPDPDKNFYWVVACNKEGCSRTEPELPAVQIGDEHQAATSPAPAPQRPSPPPTATPVATPVLATATPVPTATVAPAIGETSMEVYTAFCTAPGAADLEGELTYGQLFVEAQAAVSKFNAITPPPAVATWHIMSLAFITTLRDIAEDHPPGDTVAPTAFLVLSSQWQEVEYAAQALDPSVLEQMIEAGCIDGGETGVSADDEEPDKSSDVSEPAMDRDALVALYNAADGANWSRNRHWLSEEPIGRWQGVETNRDGRVTELNLSGYGLKGELPVELGSLSGLVVLDLDFNRLQGEIPTELGNLSRLEALRLRGEQGLQQDAPRLSGKIPSELGGLSSLLELDLSGNDLFGEIPAELGNLKKLQKLNLRENRLSGTVPSELGDLPDLVHLRLSRNYLTGEIPSALSGLQRALIIELDNNRLSGEIPPELGLLARLRILGLHENELTGHIPPQLGLLANLTRLNLHVNALDGPIPLELGQLTGLKVLTLHGNRLSGEIPPELGDLENLEVLFLYDNQLSGEIPSELGNLKKLKLLGMHGNLLSGEVPPALAAIPNLIAISLCEGNQLTCDIAGAVGEGLGESTQALFDAVATTGGAVGSVIKGLFGGWW